MTNFKIAFDSFVVGFIAFPVTYYVIKRFGAVLWEDVKNLSTTLWSKAFPAKAVVA